MVETLLDGKRHLEAAELEPDNASSRVQFKRARGNAEVGETKVRSVQARSKPGDSPDAANVGVIESVEVIDFMCHKRLVVDLCPQINFITGENGSGKSAILTAIIIALGGKAHFTNRASNLRGFIREGQSKAEVKVRLRNRGPDAFNNDVYGSSVVIERHISRQGNAGQYKIRNGDTGEVVSTRRDDIVAIIDHMGIQIDNPILILSQDASREFLANTTPDSMYRFFLKGTHLMQLSQDLNTLGEAIERIEASVKRKNEVLPQMKREKDNWKAKLEGVRRAKELWVRLNELEKEIAWAYVVEAEKDVNAARKAAQKEEQKREKTLTKLREEEVAAEQAQERLNEASARYAQREGELEAMERTLEGPNQAVAEIRRELTNLKAIEEDMNREAGIQRQVLDDLERRIEEAKARLAADQDEETRRRREKMANLGDKIKSSQDHIRECEAAQRELSERRGRLVSAANEQDQRRQRVQREISESQKALARLRQQRQNTLAAFGEGVPEVVSEIERTRWKGMKPLGPFGRYVKLRDSRWAQILETLLDKQLNAFLVETHEDRRQLDAIMRRHRCRSNIIISRVDMFDYSHGEPDPAFFTILRVLNIQDEVVTRQLINMARIEQVVLVERRADGDKIILDNDGRYPRNVTSIVSGDGYIVGSRSGGMQSQAIALSRNQGRLVADTQAMIDQENSRLEALRSDLRNIELELQSIQDEVQSCKSKHNEYEHQISNSRRAIAHAKAEIDRCEEELNELTPANISALEAERNDARQSLVAVQRQFVENRTRKAESVSKLREAEAKLAKLVDSAKGLRDEVLEIKAEIASAQGGLNKHREHCSYWREKLGQREAQLTEANKIVEDLEAKLRDTIESASQIASERVEPRADIKTLDTELNGVRIRISEIEKSQSMSMEEIAARAQTHIEAYEKAKAEIKNMVIFVKQLKEAYEERLARWGQFRDSMTVRVKMQFMSHLQLRGFTGKLEFDHIKQTLVPRVQTNQDLSAAQASRTGNSGGNAGGPRQSRSMTAHQRKDTRSLSGGERSFTTICLLLSLWEAMSCPIRALDEFDVFMDSANRRIAYFMMMQSARASAGTQFLLISPLDIDVNPAKDLRVLRLRPPDRQRTLTTQQEQ